MCGFAGYTTKTHSVEPDILTDMGNCISSRGPDSSGQWISSSRKFGCVHRRLAILDLSSAGYQPMESSCGRYVLVFNGEIYNHLQLRKFLHSTGISYVWRSNCDTETLLVLLTYLGVAKTLSLLNGMFAFTFYDTLSNKIYLARDRLGEKPLYYGLCNNTFFFSSQLKSLSPNPFWSPSYCSQAISLYLLFSYIPDPFSIYRDTFKLTPGHYVCFDAQNFILLDPIPYWTAFTHYEPKISTNDISSLIDELELRLLDSIALRMESDVPVGAFLSGGIDSSTVVALMQSSSSSPVNTFTIGLEDSYHDEAQHASAIAQHLSTNHTNFYLSDSAIKSYIPLLPLTWDEPFADSSQLPTLILCHLSKKSVTVALSGDGGDELFCGYNRYCNGYRLFSLLKDIPLLLRCILNVSIPYFSAEFYSILYKLFGNSLPPDLPTKLSKIHKLLNIHSNEDYYKSVINHGFTSPLDLFSSSIIPDHPLLNTSSWPVCSDFRETMMLLDSITYLPGDILVKLDRASMSYGLETRVPFLDHTLVEWLLRLPLSIKYHNNTSKWLLRQVLYRHVPPSLIDRPKQGFGIPIDQWLRTSLRDWADDLLSIESLSSHGLFNDQYIRKLWLEYLHGNSSHHHQIWNILMFQAWHFARL